MAMGAIKESACGRALSENTLPASVGVALAAIQGSHEMVKDKNADHDSELETLRNENTDLRARLARLEALVQTLANSQTGGGR